MNPATITLSKLVNTLQQHYGDPAPPPSTDPLELIIWENIAYLASDERRAAAFAALKRDIGTRPEQILAAKHAVLAGIGKAGILPDVNAERLLVIAKIAYEEFDGDLRAVLKKPLPQAKKALKRFPSIGDPGAEKILLLTRSCPVNGTRFEWLASAVSSGVCRGAEELFSDIPIGSGRDPWTTPQRLRFADPGTSVAPAARSRTMQAVKAALYRLSGQK